MCGSMVCRVHWNVWFHGMYSSLECVVQWCVEFIGMCGSMVCRVHWNVWFHGV